MHRKQSYLCGKECRGNGFLIVKRYHIVSLRSNIFSLWGH